MHVRGHVSCFCVFSVFVVEIRRMCVSVFVFGSFVSMISERLFCIFYHSVKVSYTLYWMCEGFLYIVSISCGFL